MSIISNRSAEVLRRQTENYCSSLALKDSVWLDRVEHLTVEVIWSRMGNLVGRIFEFGPDSKAYFFIPCECGECYGHTTGIDYEGPIRDAARERLETVEFEARCGGFGDHGHHHHCDNVLRMRATFTYRKG